MPIVADIDTIYRFTSIAASSVLFVLTLQLFFTHIPKKAEWDNFRMATRLIAVACLCLTFNEVNHYLTNTQSETASNGHLLPIIIVGVACYQAVLFTMTSVVLINPKAVKSRQVTMHLIGISISFAATITGGVIDKTHSFVYYYAIAAGYVLYIAYLVYYFNQEFHKAAKRLEAMFEDDMMTRITWVKYFFYSAFAIGIIALAVSFDPSPYLFTAFSIMVPVYYTGAEMCLSNYVSTSSFIVRSSNVNADAEEADAMLCKESATHVHSGNEEEMESVKNAITLWMDNKEYVKNDITVDEIIAGMGLKKAAFNAYFTNILHTQFRSWRSELRIQEAMNIIQHNSSIATGDLMDMVGYNDRSNFYKHFHQYAGMSVNDYRESNKKFT